MPVEAKKWKEIWDNCSWATAFSSPLWHTVTEEIESEDAAFEWEGIITPLRKIRLAKGFLHGYESSVPGVPAGPICSKTLDEKMFKQYWDILVRKTRGRFLINLRANSPFCQTSFRTTSLVNHILDIKGRKQKIHSHHKRQLKKAKEEGLVVTPARRESDFDAYWELYESSLKRWKRKPSRVYSRNFFETVREILLAGDAASFFIAWKDKLPQAGALVIYEKTRAIYWHGVTANQAINGAGHFLHWEIMNEVEKRKLKIYDFGPSPGLEGVARFKEGFGATVEPIITVVGPAALFGSYYLKRARR